MSILGEEAVSVARKAVNTYSAGEVVAGATTTFSILMSFQPLNGRDLDRLPEGQRERVTHKGYTETLLQVRPPDVVTVGGEAFQVYEVARQRAVIPHYRCLLIKVTES